MKQSPKLQERGSIRNNFTSVLVLSCFKVVRLIKDTSKSYKAPGLPLEYTVYLSFSTIYTLWSDLKKEDEMTWMEVFCHFLFETPLEEGSDPLETSTQSVMKKYWACFSGHFIYLISFQYPLYWLASHNFNVQHILQLHLSNQLPSSFFLVAIMRKSPACFGYLKTDSNIEINVKWLLFQTYELQMKY